MIFVVQYPIFFVNPPEVSTKGHIQWLSLLLSCDTQVDSCPQCNESRDLGTGSPLRWGNSTFVSREKVFWCLLLSFVSQRFRWSALVRAGSWCFSFSSSESHPVVRWKWKRRWTRFQACQRTPTQWIKIEVQEVILIFDQNLCFYEHTRVQLG